MNISNYTTAFTRQQPLPFPFINDQVDLWTGLPEPHQQECRHVLRQMLVAIIHQSRNVTHDDQAFLTQGSEQHNDD